MNRPMATNGTPHSFMNQEPCMRITIISQKIANPPHIRLNGIMNRSAACNLTPVRGRPLHSKLSPPLRNGWTSIWASFHGMVASRNMQREWVRDRYRRSGGDHSVAVPPPPGLFPRLRSGALHQLDAIAERIAHIAAANPGDGQGVRDRHSGRPAAGERLCEGIDLEAGVGLACGLKRRIDAEMHPHRAGSEP